MQLIQFNVEGVGKIIGVGNGDPSSHEPDKCAEGKWQRHLFNGKAQLIVQSLLKEGDCTLIASSPGLQSAQLKLEVKGNSLKRYTMDSKK